MRPPGRNVVAAAWAERGRVRLGGPAVAAVWAGPRSRPRSSRRRRGGPGF